MKNPLGKTARNEDGRITGLGTGEGDMTEVLELNMVNEKAFYFSEKFINEFSTLISLNWSKKREDPIWDPNDRPVVSVHPRK